jgi:hypothetical protein
MNTPADTLRTGSDPADGRTAAVTIPEPGPLFPNWTAVEGSLLPPGSAWVEAERA